MKRILAIAFVLQILISSACLAFEPPTDERWKKIIDDDEREVWVDRDTVKCKIQNDYSPSDHRKHKLVEFWVMWYKFETNQY